MNNLSRNYVPNSLDFENIPTATITISHQEISENLEIISKITQNQQQWQAYLNLLAFIVFKKWLNTRNITFNQSLNKYTICQAEYVNFINAICNLQVGEFTICLIAIGSLTDELINLPQVIVDLPEFTPHFYVLVEVLEEEKMGLVSGFISYQKLIKNLTTSNLQPEFDWNYQVPLSWFDSNFNRLLLYLRCLQPEIIALPSIPERISALRIFESELIELLPQLISPKRQLWEVLTWEQATLVFTTPELLDWIYKKQLQFGKESQEVENERIRLSDLFKLLTQPAINVERWLSNQLDELAQQLSWMLLPSLVPTSALRSTKEEFAAIAIQLQKQGLKLPLDARGAYQDLLLFGIPLRLYAVTWYFTSQFDKDEWTLLLILGTVTGGYIPLNLKLCISDKNGILVEKGVDTNNTPYLFARVIGSIDEKFLVKIILRKGVDLTLPPFGFDK
ncbi:MAG: DUF1822 family protein [Nostocales cyanobacterium 94392]|nr:DUF1822 family protein [Nostocales cyanobacterium 94392]